MRLKRKRKLKEIWKQVVGWPRYEISNLGNVRRVVTPYPSSRNGAYRLVSLWNGHGKRVGRGVHVLVAEAFIGPRPAGMIPDHVDGNPSNNREDNLEYVTPSENAKRAVRMGRLIPPNPQPKLSKESIQEVRKRYRAGEAPKSLMEEFDIAHPTLMKYTKGIAREQGHKVRRGLGAKIASEWVPQKVTVKMLAAKYNLSEGYTRVLLWRLRGRVQGKMAGQKKQRNSS